jgi:hypothetical protein
MHNVPGCTCPDVDGIHGEDPGLDAADLTETVADPLVEEGGPYLPSEALAAQAAILMVYSKRVGGHIGTLLGVASSALTLACEAWEHENGSFALGDAPPYHTELS